MAQLPDKNIWSGIFPSLCTPFAEDGSIDLRAQRDVARFAIASGAHGIVCLGLAGEVTRLTSDERKQLCDVILEEVNGEVPVLVGVGGEAEHTTADLARHAQHAGADGLVIPPPITAHAPVEALEHYFLSVAARTHLPIMIQDAPAYLGVELSPQLVNRLTTAQSNIRHLKIESGPEGTADWVARLGPSVRVFTGDAGLHLLSTLRAGAVGNIPGVEFTDLLVAVYNAENRGDPVAADGLFYRLLPYLVFSLQNLDHYNACTKEVLVRRGILRRGGLRTPAPLLTPLAHTLLDRYLGNPPHEEGLLTSLSAMGLRAQA